MAHTSSSSVHAYGAANAGSGAKGTGWIFQIWQRFLRLFVPGAAERPAGCGACV